MALMHAQPLDVIDVRPLGPRLRNSTTSSLLKAESIQLMRVVLQAGEGIPEHSVVGAITVQCLEGVALVTTPARPIELSAGQLVVLAGGEPHSVRALTDSSLLVTVLLRSK